LIILSTFEELVVVLNYIFGGENNFNAEKLEELKGIMYIAELDNGCLYGKTGSGTDGGVRNVKI